MRTGQQQQAGAAASRYWPLFRFDPTMRKSGHNPFLLDSPRPSIPLKDYGYRERRYSSLTQPQPIPAALGGRRPADQTTHDNIVIAGYRTKVR